MSTDASSFPDDPAELKALLARAYDDLDSAHNELSQLCDNINSERAHHEQVVTQFEQTVDTQQQTIERQQQEIARLLRRLSGPKQERIDPNQLTLFDVEELRALIAEQSSEETPDEQPAPRRRRKGHGRRPLPEHLPREQVLYELPESERCCPCCGELRLEIGRETSEQLEYIPAAFKVIEHIRVKYACRACEEHVAIAAKPPQPIEKGLPGPGLLAQTVLSKYGDHLPLYRQEDIFSRHGIIIRRSTLCDWIAAAADLARPLYELMCRLVLDSKVIHTDDTSVPLLDPLIGHARQARFWAYIGDVDHPYSVYDFTDSRKRDGPEKFLTGYHGYLQADAYGGYDGIYLNSKGGIIEVACWAHARRYWWEAKTSDSRRAHEAISYIAQLYQIEEALRERTSDERCALRKEHALPILQRFRSWMEEQSPQVLPKSPLGKAMTYTRNQWTALNRYCEHGNLSIDNNISERTVKIPALGRKNWLFVATPAGGRRAAILMSLVASAKANQVEPWHWLRDLVATLPLLGESPTPADLTPLLPNHWLTTHPQHRWTINELRAKTSRK